MAPPNLASSSHSTGPPPSVHGGLDTWSDRPTLLSHNSKTNMSSLRPRREMTFPQELPPPTNIPFRERLQNFAALDAVFNKTEHAVLENQGIGRGRYEKETDESRSKDAAKDFEKHVKERMPYIQLASDRLQAVCGVRNDSPFDLPELPKRHLSASLRSLYDMPKEGFASSAKPRAPDLGGIQGKKAARNTGGKARVDSGVGFIPKIPVGMHVVDKATGKGLREFLLQKGKECGMRKRECKSITFHDFTPDMRTGKHSNLLLGHYGVEKGERVGVYEVDLPATQTDDKSGEEFPSTETWIWILISRPIVSYDPNDKATIPPANTSQGDFFAKLLPSVPEEPSLHTTPPNFPRPIPLSWLVFAAPEAHITAYPESVEHLEEDIPSYLFASDSKKIEKRIDYDFSFSGIPIFEFSSADMFIHTTKPTEFLSIEQMGAWSSSDLYEEYTPEEYKRIFSMWEDGEWGSRASFMHGATGDLGLDDEGRPKASMPAPNRGVWWKVFYQRMYEDCARWKKIRKAMSLGKCRVVVRWNEYHDDGEVNRGYGGVVGAQQVVGGKKGAKEKRMTRSETRRRSGLGPSDSSSGGGASLGEATKTRVTSNRDLGRAAGSTSEKEKKVKKR